jgi:hypothetical protein
MDASTGVAIRAEPAIFLSDSVPFITLYSGSIESLDFHLSAWGNGHRLENKTTFGRSSENLIVLRDDKVSRYHGQFNVEGEDWLVEDFNSNRGTYVNGERITARRVLESGDKIGVGEFVFAFERTQIS